MSLQYSSFLNNYVDWTDEEIAVGKKYLKWEELTVNWEDLNLIWEDISILLEVVETLRKRGGSGGSYKEYMEKNPWDVTKRELKKELGEEKIKKFIKLVCRVNNLEFEEERELKTNIDITVDHLEKVINEATKIGIKID
jgi:hypothetical protein